MIYSKNISVFCAPVEAVVHQANCMCTMGAGLAKVIKEQFPEAYEADLKTKRGDQNKLGTFSFAKVYHPLVPQIKYIFNMYSQFRFGSDKAHTDYEAMGRALSNIFDYMESSKIKSLGIPYGMGCNRGGGKWSKVLDVLNESIGFDHVDLDIWICEYNER